MVEAGIRVGANSDLLLGGKAWLYNIQLDLGEVSMGMTGGWCGRSSWCKVIKTLGVWEPEIGWGHWWEKIHLIIKGSRVIVNSWALGFNGSKFVLILLPLTRDFGQVAVFLGLFPQLQNGKYICVIGFIVSSPKIHVLKS